MIETLNAIHEKVNFENESLILFYDKTAHQSYPLHWHTAIEIIMPVSRKSMRIDQGSIQYCGTVAV